MRRKIEKYYSTMVEQGLYPNKIRLKFHVNSLFRGVELSGKRILDIGGGIGLHSFYAANAGAKQVLCVEPEADGSREGIIDKFLSIKRGLGLENISHFSDTFQNLDSDDTYDVILLHNSINHLDEGACEKLFQDDEAKKIYKALFYKLGELSKSGTQIILCDCSNNNLWERWNLGNPFVPSIEWHLHQPPDVWKVFLKDAGFINAKIEWISFNFKIGKLLSNILTSEYRIKAEKG